MHFKILLATLLVAMPGLLFTAWAGQDTDAGKNDTPYRISIVEGHFKPATLTIPAGQRVKIMVANTTALPAEFESYDITVEKVIPGGTTLPVYLGPLKAGSYGFFNDFAQGVTGKLIVR